MTRDLLARYKALWQQRASTGGVLSTINEFLPDFDGGYGPRSGKAGVLDPVDALRPPYG